MPSSALSDLLARRIRAAGPITVAEFMTEALQHPRLGYYAARDPLGAAGDFITAPEVSQVFGELIGLWCAETWTRLGAPDPVALVELGPGRGTLMADALRALRTVPALRRALRVHLVETSPQLRAMQRQALAGGEPAWHDNLAGVPEMPVLLIANEFLDALPIRQFERRADGWHERRVAVAGDSAEFAFVLDPKPTPLPGLPPAASGAIFEIAPAAQALAAELGTRFGRHAGAALLIDYGYWPSALGDTLQAVRGHRRHPVLTAPGSADLTAHVDFAAVGAAAKAAGARVHGPVTQRDFLSALGIREREAALVAKATPAQAAAIRSGVERLIAPEAMGGLFKVMALSSRETAALAGFAAAPP